MVIKLLGGCLILLSLVIGFGHGIGTLRHKASAAELTMMAQLGITETIRQAIAITSILLALLIVFPGTFFAGNLLRALMIVSTMALSLKAGNYKFALIEIPFLLLPFVLIYLDHPLKR